MKQIRITILLIAISILLCACPKDENGHRYITFVNKSDKNISCQQAWSRYSNSEDTLYHCRKFALQINSNSSHNFECTIRSSGWEEEFSNDNYYLQYLVMNAETYDQYISEPCDTIRKYVPILHTYRLTLEDLQRMNWTVEYPPEEQ